MIPDFDDLGNLPRGIYLASLDEIAERFSWQSEPRQAQMESLRWLVPLAKQAGITRLVINGSFVTDNPEPNDVDCVLLMADAYPYDADADAEIEAGLPFLDIHVVDQDGFDAYVGKMFGTDRYFNPKGMVEVTL